MQTKEDIIKIMRHQNLPFWEIYRADTRYNSPKLFARFFSGEDEDTKADKKLLLEKSLAQLDEFVDNAVRAGGVITIRAREYERSSREYTYEVSPVSTPTSQPLGALPEAINTLGMIQEARNLDREHTAKREELLELKFMLMMREEKLKDKEEALRLKIAEIETREKEIEDGLTRPKKLLEGFAKSMMDGLLDKGEDTLKGIEEGKEEPTDEYKLVEEIAANIFENVKNIDDIRLIGLHVNHLINMPNVFALLKPMITTGDYSGITVAIEKEVSS